MKLLGKRNKQFKISLNEVFSAGDTFSAICKSHKQPKVGEIYSVKHKKSGISGNYLLYSVYNSSVNTLGKRLNSRLFLFIKAEDYERQLGLMQQRLKYGFDDTDLYNLDTEILDFIIPRLKRFRDVNTAKWKIEDPFTGNIKETDPTEVINEMIYGFELLYQVKDYHLNKDDVPKINKAFDLYKEHFLDLWY